MNAGPEFLFWLVFFGLIALVAGFYEAVQMIAKLRNARREILTLRAENARLRRWLHPDLTRSEAGEGRVRYAKDLVIGST